MEEIRRYIKTNQTNEFFRLFGTALQEFDWNFPVSGHISKESCQERGKEFKLDVYARIFMDYHRIRAIERVMTDNPYLKISSVNLNSKRYLIQGGLVSGCFVYKRNKNSKRISIARCDNLFNISDTSVMINFWYKEFPKMKYERSEVFLDFFRDKLAYGIITTEDNIKGRANYFDDRGGVVLPLLMTKEELKTKVRDVCNSRGLRVMDE